MRAIALVVFALLFVSCSSPPPDVDPVTSRSPTSLADVGEHVGQIHYLEIVTKEVDAVCAVYTAANGHQFGDADPRFGNARTAALPGGGMVGIRAPMRESEEPVVRPYWLVDDIESAVAAAEDAGSEIAHPPLKVPGLGTFAIYIKGGVEHGLWQRSERASP